MAKEYALNFYKGKEWIKCRSSFMKNKHWICERCGKPAHIAHHKKYITPFNINNPNIILSWDNLEALCQECHNKVHMTSNACIDGVTFDDNGDLIYTPQVKK